MKALSLNIPGTNNEPEIIFSEGVLTIKGRSIPSDSSQLYNPVIENFYRYTLDPFPFTEIHIQLEYVNSTSNRSLLNLLIIAEQLFNEKKQVKVSWYYHPRDEIMYDQGKIFQELLDMPISLIPAEPEILM
jgi:hypothetical protein